MIFTTPHGSIYLAQANDGKPLKIEGKFRGWCFSSRSGGDFCFYKYDWLPGQNASYQIKSAVIPTVPDSNLGRMFFSTISGRLYLLCETLADDKVRCYALTGSDGPEGIKPGDMVGTKMSNLERVPRGFKFEFKNPFP